MPSIDPNLIPTVSPGNLFSALTTDDSISIRWLVSLDPVFYETLNRPLADSVVRQLILAKTVDNLTLRISHQNLFPFLVPPQILSNSTAYDLPASWIWDMHVSLPVKWKKVRLSSIKRMSGSNPSTGSEYTGVLRFIFTAELDGSTAETAIFQADYNIDSLLSYQLVDVSIPSIVDESNAVSQGESETIGGSIIFNTLDVTDTTVQDFFDALAPAETGSKRYWMKDTEVGGSGIDDDYSLSGLVHGTGLLISSATNYITDISSDVNTWINSFNYPFDSDATLQSSSHPNIVIPSGLFREFDLIAPSSEEPTGDTSGDYFPVWISKITRDDSSADQLTFTFSTYNVDTSSTVPIEFAQLTLDRAFSADRKVEISPIRSLYPGKDDGADTVWVQEFGTGYVVLSTLWGGSAGTVDSFFDLFLGVSETPPDVTFTKVTGRISSYGLTRIPKTIPSLGQWRALRGSLGDSEPPEEDNPFVVYNDQGEGSLVDFSTHPDLDDDLRTNADIDRYGYSGSLTHRIVKLVVDGSGDDHDYDTDILPRLKILFGSDTIPEFSGWWDGSRLKWYIDGNWIG